MPDSGNITELLHQWRLGNSSAESELFTLVLPGLRRLARRLMQGERRGHSLQATELVDQIYFRLAGARHRDWHDRRHFFAFAARAMRHHLTDYARGRPQAEFVALNGLENVLPAESRRLDQAVTVARLLDQLAAINPEWCTLVEVKYFLGLTDQEAAEALGMKLRTLQRTWLDARRWLFARMESNDAAQYAGR